MRIAISLLGLIFFVLFVVFAVSNSETQTLTLFPLPFAVEVPVFLPVLLALSVGFVWGGVAMWLSQAPQRRALKEQKQRGEALRQQLEQQRATTKPVPVATDRAA